MAKHRRKVPRYLRKAASEVTGAWDPRVCAAEVYDARMAELPAGAIPADQRLLSDHHGYSPPFWYQDRPFRCADCGSDEVWTAERQKWWYEVAKGSIHATATRCRACRAARRCLHGGTPRRSHRDRIAAADADPPEASLERTDP